MAKKDYPDSAERVRYSGKLSRIKDELLIFFYFPDPLHLIKGVKMEYFLKGKLIKNL